ncbi:MAG: thiamine pyrophosphate-binding protein [Phycisphaerales bacterium]|nr:thiamine pyrophosphate-binding protein [Phycisphaerales bacterium]
MSIIDGKKIHNTVAQATNVAEYVVARLVDIGISDCFAVPGDYAFPIDHALVHNDKLRYIGCVNELNASYAADGYARIKGAGILCTTFAVGELSALNGLMGSKAEHVPVFSLVGAPALSHQMQRKKMHHSLGDGDFDIFRLISSHAACVSTVITTDNVVAEMDRVIHECFKKRQPAYILIPADIAEAPLTYKHVDNQQIAIYISNPLQLQKALKFILDKITSAKKIVVLPSINLSRFDLNSHALGFIEKLGVPFAVLPQDKCVLEEHHPQYLGYYSGALSNPDVANYIESADLLIDLGQIMLSDINTAAFSTKLDTRNILTCAPDFVAMGDTLLSSVFLRELLDALIPQLPKKDTFVSAKKTVSSVVGRPDEKITVDAFYSRLIQFVKKDDIIVVETGSSSVELPSLRFQENTTYLNQTNWGSIGWATAATLGACIASPNKRVILVTGEGSHQISSGEIGTMGRYGVKPIIFCCNNRGYTVERALDKKEKTALFFNNLAPWEYAQLPCIMGCKDWITFKVLTNSELEDALQKAAQASVGVYIEFVTDKYDYNRSLQFYNKNWI